MKLSRMAAMLLAPTFALGAPLLAEVSEPYWSPAEIAEFGDWSVSCNNLNVCVAGSFSEALVQEQSTAGFSQLMEPTVWIGRKADPLSEPVFILDYSAWGDVPQADWLELLVYYSEFEGHGTDEDIFGPAYVIEEREPEIYRIAQEQVIGLLAESGRSDQLAIRGKSGELTALISTKGLNAAMRYMDEQQGRAGTVTATIAKGPAPWQKVTKRPKKPWVYGARQAGEIELPARSNAEVEKIRERVCGVWLRGLGPEIHAFRLDNSDRLWQVECSATLKFNPWILWLVEKPDGRILMPMLAPFQAALQEPVLPNSSFDPASGEITSIFKLREAGDCGEQGKWVWTGEKFDLTEFRKMPSCTGLRPDQWFVLYEAALGSLSEKPEQ